MRRRIFTILCPGSLVQRGSVAVDRTKRLLQRMTVRRWLLVCAALLALSIEACCWSYRLGEISGRASVAKRQPEEMAPTRPATVTEALTAVVPFPTTTVAESNVEDLIGDIEEEERLRTQLQEIGAGPDYVEARVQTLIAEQAKRRKH